MRSRFNLMSLALLCVIILGLVAPVVGQDELMSMSAESCDYGGEMKAIEALDSLTVRFTLCYADPAFPSKVAFSAFGIHPSEHLEATAGDKSILTNPVGTGPYKLERWDPGNEMVFTRNEAYWGDKAIEPTLIFRWSAESSARLNELRAGTIDGFDNPAPLDFDAVTSDPSLALYTRPSDNIFYLGINNRFEPFNDVRVRQALAYAIDKQRIVDNFYPPGSAIATQFMPPSIFGYTDPAAYPDMAPFPYDVAMAEKLLDEAGLPRGADGVRFEVPMRLRDVVRGYLPTPVIVAQDIQAQLATVGIKVNIEVLESAALGQLLSGEGSPLFMLGWGADYPDATNFLDVHFGIGAGTNFGDKDSAITDLLTEAGKLSDPAARLEVYARANAAIRDFTPMIPIAHGGSATVFRADIEGAYASSPAGEQFRVMEDPTDDNIVWMQNGEPLSLYCADEGDGETLRACEQVNESLLSYEIGKGGNVVPALATEYSANDDLTEWTFKLREGVKFHDGTDLDANDVVLSYVVQWDASHPLHVGRDGLFSYFNSLFAAFLNAPPAE